MEQELKNFDSDYNTDSDYTTFDQVTFSFLTGEVGTAI